MSFLGGLVALVAVCGLVRLARRSLALATIVTALLICFGVPALHAVNAAVSQARDGIHRWQQDRIAAGACAFAAETETPDIVARCSRSSTSTTSPSSPTSRPW